MKFDAIFDNETSENTYLVYDEETKNGVIIDPGCTLDKISKLIADNGVTVRYILLTHCHYDHIASLTALKEITGAKAVASEKCNENLGNIGVNLTRHGLGRDITESADIVLGDGEVVTVDSMDIRCIATPGHTDGGVCYLVGNDLWSGDTLFLRSVGRWDLPTGDYATLETSIKNKLYVLPDEVRVHPGHGSATSIGYEKKFNLCIPL